MEKIIENWEIIAKKILNQEKVLREYNHPIPTGVILKWKKDIYIGSIQEIVPEFSKEIILLSKSSCPIPENLADAIKKLDMERIELIADNDLNLTERCHILRILKNRLTYLTPEQTEYMIEHPIDLNELCEIG